MTDPIDPLSGPQYVLEGRLVTMGPAGVIPDGAIYIEAGEIRAVQPAFQDPPPGFESAPRIRTGDSIYPGLIELHNHLSYNAIPLWDVPRRFTNSAQWKNHEDYRRRITKPAQVLGRTPGLVESLVRFAECRCLLGGVTTSQGITLSSAPGIQKYYEGIVRNVERTHEDALPAAGTKIANPSTGKAEKYLDILSGHTCYLQHLSEGIGDTARGWFQRLQLDNGEWAINDAFCGIHSTALRREDFDLIHERGGSVVWSPLSNFLLYGDTTDIQAAHDAGIAMAIGCDWAPSGTKNLLGELKVAWLTSEERGGVFTARELVAMATVNAARILRWDAVLGTIEPGKRADLVCINGQQGDDYLRLIEARDTSVTFVVINGVPRLGQKRLMLRFGPGTESIRVGRSERILNLEQETTHPLVRDLSLTEATERLVEGMRNLPALAQDLDNASATGLFGGSLDAEGTPWRIVFEVDEEGVDELALAAQPLASYVEPMELEPITVADDPTHLEKLVAARNLPEYVKTGLPPLYGESIPLPDSAMFLRETDEPMPAQLVATTRDLKTFLRTWGELTLGERLDIVDQALIVLEDHYVHLPLKRAMHAVDPIQRLKLLQHRLREEDEAGMGPEIDFHNELASIFRSMRDLHTAYRLPAPYKSKTAWLPFLVEEFWEHGTPSYVVSKVVGDAGPDTFVPGVEVLHWNGLPIERAVARNADRHAGSNDAARHARGLNSLTIRPLAQGLPPEEDWVALSYRGLDGVIREWKQEWLVFEPGRSLNSLNPETLVTAATTFGLDAQTDDIQESKKVLFAGNTLAAETREAERRKGRPVLNAADGVATFLPTVFRARRVDTAQGRLGHLRIFTFNVRSAQGFVEEFVRLVEKLPDRGLILDVRGNGGGLIHAAEQLLQVLTPQRIEPERAQFVNSPGNLELCRRHAPSPLFSELDLEPWIGSIAQSVRTGATYSTGHPITAAESCNAIGQRYYGRVVLVTDALCYSATDIFAAGFQDHGIGPVLGTASNTGAGGANVWSHALLVALMHAGDGTDSRLAQYLPLPKGADLRVAVRRTVRVGPNAGSIIEDLGVVPDAVHRMTRNDLLGNNQDLMEAAAQMLSRSKPHKLRVRLEQDEDGAPIAKLTTRNVTRVDVLADGRPQRSLDIERQTTHVNLADLPAGAATLELQGFDGNDLVARVRLDL